MEATLLAFGLDMSTSSYLTQNLRYLMQEKGLTANQIGQGGGPSQPTISRILKGNSANQSSIEALASFFAVPMADLIGKDLQHEAQIAAFESPNAGPLHKTVTVISQEESKKEVSLIMLPSLDVQASCGAGRVVLNQPSIGDADVGLPVIWFNSRKLDPQFCGTSIAHGDSMSPTILDGATCIIDFRPVSCVIKDSNVYIFCWGDEWFIKRIFKTQSGLMLRSDNPDRNRYPDKHVEREAMNHVRILGRVVTAMSDM